MESSFPLIKEQALVILQEDTLELYKCKLTSSIPKVEEVILMSNEDEEEVLAIMDEGPKQTSQTSPMSLVGL